VERGRWARPGPCVGLFAALGLTLRRIRQNHTQIAVLIAINFALAS
jgi:hypothetical protein